MSLKLKRGRVTFENAIITNTRTTNCFLILFPKQFLQMTVTLYTTWRLIQGLVHRYSSLPRRRGFRHVFLAQDGEDCVKSEKTWEASPSANWSHPARDTKVVYNETKKYTSNYKPPPPSPRSRMELDQQYCIRSFSWSRDPLSVKTKTVCFWKILLARAESIGVREIFCQGGR